MRILPILLLGQFLKEEGMDENTVVTLTSDNRGLLELPTAKALQQKR
jgi:hypothetical protein